MLTVAELAAYLGVTEAAVRQAIRRHHIPAASRRRGNRKIYDAKMVLAVTGRHDRRAGLAQYQDHESQFPQQECL